MAISVVGQYPKFRAWDPLTKLPLVGGKLYCYAPGTTTNKAIYTTYARTVQAANPVILDANGEGLFYLDGIYDLALFDSNDVAVWTVANYNDQPVSASSTTTAPTIEGSPTNPSFEYEGATAGLPSNWTIFKWNTVVLDTAVSFSGTKSLKFTSPGGAPGTSGGGTATSDKFITSPASTISLGVTLKSSVAGVHNQVQILEYNSADALQATTTIYDDAAVNPATFTTFWRTVTLGANTAWAKIYIVGAHNDSAVAGTTWIDSVEIRQAEAGGNIKLKHLTFAGSLLIDSTGLTVSTTNALKIGITTTGILALLSATLTLDGTTSTTVTTPTLAINTAISTTVATPSLVVNATTSTSITAPTLTITSTTSVGITTPALTLNSATSITIVTPLITSVLGLVVGAATGGAKGNGTINAVGLYNNNSLVLTNGTQALVSTLTLTGQAVVLGAPTGGAGGGAGTINAVNLFSNGKEVLKQGSNALTEALNFTSATFNVSFPNAISGFTSRAAVLAVAASATTQVVAHGTVSSAGTLLTGQGFTSVRSALGLYALTWTTAFGSVPGVTVGRDTSFGFARVTPTTTGCTIEFSDVAGTAGVDAPFGVVAVGNK